LSSIMVICMLTAIRLLLSFRMQGVEFDNGDMYVDGHKAASDVRDEFVSVTEKLMDELAQCYNVLPQLDINKIGRASCRERVKILVVGVCVEKRMLSVYV